MKQLWTLAILLGGLQVAYGQQLPLWAQFREFNHVYNPALIDVFDIEDSWNSLDLDLAYRLSWTSIEGAPRTGSLGAQYVNRDWNMGFGGSFVHDRFGPTTFTRFKLFYAYRLNFSQRKDHGLSIGLSGQLAQFRIDGSEVIAPDLNDRLLNSNVQSSSAMNAGLGIYYSLQMGKSVSNPAYLLVGVALDQGIPSDLLIDGNGEQANLQQVMHLNAQLAFRFYHGYYADYVELVGLARVADSAPLLFLAGVRTTFLEQRLHFGLMLSESFEGYFQFGLDIIPRLRLGYSYSFFLANSFSAPQKPGGSHEIALGYRFEF